jgi:hypothetical protein
MLTVRAGVLPVCALANFLRGHEVHGQDYEEKSQCNSDFSKGSFHSMTSL